jgi:hypothetical protein
MIEVELAILRLVLTALLYLFLFLIILVTLRDLRVAARQAGTPHLSAGARLIVVDAGQSGLSPGDTFPVPPVTSLGRALTNTIVLPDTFASGAHALLTARNGRWWLEDLGSRNGTFLNGDRIAEPAVVGRDDVIGVGSVRFKFEPA